MVKSFALSADLLTHLMHPTALVLSCGVEKLGNQSIRQFPEEQAGVYGRNEEKQIRTP